jgi:hypothetical protein
MGVRKFLHFERVKLILPVVLIVLLWLLILLKPARDAPDALSYVFNGVLLTMDSMYQGYFLTPIHQYVYGTPFVDLPIFMAILFIFGYVLSSAVLWMNRRNKAIYNRGNEVYYVLAASIVVIFAAFYASDIDAMWSLIFAAIFSYILVTYAWSYYDKKKAGRIVKKLKKERKLRTN